MLRGYHFIADIKYPNIPEVISPEKALNVLEKLRNLSNQNIFKWQPIYKPSSNLFIHYFV